MSGRDEPLPVPPEWASPELCDGCGGFHRGRYCPAPVTGLPPGLFTIGSGLTPLGEVVAYAADHLAMRHSFMLAPDDDEWPFWIFAQLVTMWQQGPCGRCISRKLWNWKELAHHFMGCKEEEYDRALPTWTCECGAPFKLMHTFGDAWEFCQPDEDGLSGDQVGAIALDSKGRVKRSDACPACGRSFAGTIARRADPQGSLF
jgi:hypothetical protein